MTADALRYRYRGHIAKGGMVRVIVFGPEFFVGEYLVLNGVQQFRIRGHLSSFLRHDHQNEFPLCSRRLDTATPGP
jgi:hypothetical protein